MAILSSSWFSGSRFLVFRWPALAWPLPGAPCAPGEGGAGLGETSPVQSLLPAPFWQPPAEGMRMKSCLLIVFFAVSLHEEPKNTRNIFFRFRFFFLYSAPAQEGHPGWNSVS